MAKGIKERFDDFLHLLQAKMDEYDERLGIIVEGRKASDEDILEAWESTLHRDFRPRRKTNE